MWEDEVKAIQLLPEDDSNRLQRFGNLFTKSLDLIVTALATNRTIPHSIFKVREYFA